MPLCHNSIKDGVIKTETNNCSLDKNVRVIDILMTKRKHKHTQTNNKWRQAILRELFKIMVIHISNS